MHPKSEWILVIMALLLGIRHGLDLDHLATIDSITRTVCNNQAFSRMVGFLFSLGHGLVIITISLLIGIGVVQSHAPHWLAAFGNWISIIFLFIFGLLNLVNIVQHPLKSSTTLKSNLALKLFNKNFKPTSVIFIGILFAFSFDTFSQIALFSLSANAIAGWLFSGLLGLIFMLGMMILDGLNGFIVSKLIQHTNNISFIISRAIGLLIAMFSLIIGIMNAVKIINSFL